MNLHAPPPGSHSGVADYAQALHKRLATLGSLDVPLYHLGNNRLHGDIYRQALARPGVIVLHDAVLNHFLLGTLNGEEYVEEFVYNYGEWNRSLAAELWNDRAGSGVDPRYFRYPMIKRVAESARAVIVHNPGAASIAKEHGARTVHVIPHFFEPLGLPGAVETALFRARIGIPAGATLFGIFGYLRETKRVMTILQVFDRLHATNPAARLLLAGEIVSPYLARLIVGETSRPGVVLLPHLRAGDFATAIASIDCCINLRYPAAGETSGIAIRMMGAGKPVILTENAENSEFPAHACLRVSAGAGESSELADYMTLVSRFPRVATDIGNEARRHILNLHSPEDAARLYWQVLTGSAGLSPKDGTPVVIDSDC